MKIRSILLASLIAAVPAIAPAQQPPRTATVIEKEKTAVAVADAVELQGVVTALDKGTRVLTIRGAAGNEMTVAAGPEINNFKKIKIGDLVTLSYVACLLYTSPSPRDGLLSRMPSSA